MMVGSSDDYLISSIYLDLMEKLSPTPHSHKVKPIFIGNPIPNSHRLLNYFLKEGYREQKPGG